MLTRHNEVRALHGVSALAFNSTLNPQALSWAETIVASGQFVHSAANGYGENLSMIKNSALIANDTTCARN